MSMIARATKLLASVLLVATASVTFSALFSLHRSSSLLQALDDIQAPSASGRRNKSPKVLYTVFAGRKNRLLLQEPYWVEMIKLGAIDEVHLWDFVPRRRVNETSNPDRDHMLHLAGKYSSFLSIKEPRRVRMNETYWYDWNHSLGRALEQYGDGRALFKDPAIRGYSEYYKYYTDNPYDGVIIKADDDITFVNSTMVRPFAEYLWNHKEIFLLSASVINQGLCAYYQQKHGAVPESYMKLPFPGNGMGELIENATQGYRLQEYFVSSEENRRRFFITEPEYYNFTFTINVNFVAIRGSDMHETWEMIQEKLSVHEEHRYYDEGTLTWDAIRKRKKIEGIYMPLVVVHATFSHQRVLHNELVKLWTDWARRERADFYRGILT